MMRLLLVSGSTRGGSTNTAVLRTVAALAGDDAVLYEGLSALPAYNPDDDREPVAPAVADLRARIRDADAVLVCTPEYGGGLPGAFKNLLDWNVGDDHPRSLHGTPVAWVNVSSPAAPTGGADAHASLAKFFAYVGADVVDAACVRLPMTRAAVGADGLVADEECRATLRGVLDALGEHVAARR